MRLVIWTLNTTLAAVGVILSVAANADKLFLFNALFLGFDAMMLHSTYTEKEGER